jgi:hypothetical protein
MQTSQRLTIASAGPALEAVRSAADATPAVVAPPHPLYGGSIDVPVVAAMIRALERSGHAPLAFNWRGVGGSGGRASGELADAIEDYSAAADFVATASARAFVAAGYSWGAAAALCVAARRDDVESLLLIAPPVAMTEQLPWHAARITIHVVVGSADPFAPVESLRRIVAEIDRPNVRLDVVDGADHFFTLGGIEEVERLVAERC